MSLKLIEQVTANAETNSTTITQTCCGSLAVIASKKLSLMARPQKNHGTFSRPISTKLTQCVPYINTMSIHRLNSKTT